MTWDSVSSHRLRASRSQLLIGRCSARPSHTSQHLLRKNKISRACSDHISHCESVYQFCRCKFYGHLSPASAPGSYVALVQDLFAHYTSHLSGIPLVTNTMGWNKGHGLILLTDTLRTVRPDVVLQIDSASHGRNLPEVSREFAAREFGWLTQRVSRWEYERCSILNRVKHLHDCTIVYPIR